MQDDWTSPVANEFGQESELPSVLLVRVMLESIGSFDAFGVREMLPSNSIPFGPSQQSGLVRTSGRLVPLTLLIVMLSVAPELK